MVHIKDYWMLNLYQKLIENELRKNVETDEVEDKIKEEFHKCFE